MGSAWEPPVIIPPETRCWYCWKATDDLLVIGGEHLYIRVCGACRPEHEMERRIYFDDPGLAAIQPVG